ncbi:MAG: germination protein YpeB [Clostridia bacterium]|nr:germination protein YpeB [Clostridia bacterium]
MKSITFSKHYGTKKILLLTAVFTAALIVLLGVWGVLQYRDANRYKAQVRYTCESALYDLSAHLQSMDEALKKSLYAGTAYGLETLSAQVYEAGGYARSCLAQLPVGYTTLENTELYLAQASEYMLALGRKASQGYSLTEQDRTAMQKLSEIAELLSVQVGQLRDQMNDTGIWELENDDILYGSQGQNASFYTSIQKLEQAMTDYDSMTYDGLYSDHYRTRTSELLQSAQEITRQQARQKAAALLNKDAAALTDDGDAFGVIEAYRFIGDGFSIAISKRGGYAVSLLKNRSVTTESRLSEGGARQKAEAFLTRCGFEDAKFSHASTADGICVVQFYSEQDGVLVYADAIEVAVAMDDGEILGLESSDYLLNHRQHGFSAAKHTAYDVAKKLSSLLTLRNARLTTLPNSASEELCWEMTCEGSNGETVTVYFTDDGLLEKRIVIQQDTRS